ncbi:Crp/Fnr family transcriptional regulator [Marimonas sp. MJW-29]|uniref:Crp/Fnr family transcriptional regulator n=1 Tax=Sulfitobacter sediminis TaxID=3234186 RepID=A0ABV3RLV7_9RHOB
MQKDDHLFRQGDPTRGLFRVETGQVNLQRITPEGHIITLHRASAGTLFAEASLFSDSYHCDAVCVRPGAVLRLDKKHILDRLASDQGFSLAFNRLLAQQVQGYRQTIELTSIRSARDRTFAAISLGYLSGSVTEMAHRIGLTHEACYRALRELCDTGLLIRTGRGRYEIAIKPNKKRPRHKGGA